MQARGRCEGVHSEEEACEREGIGPNRHTGTISHRMEDTGKGRNDKGKLHCREDQVRREHRRNDMCKGEHGGSNMDVPYLC